MELKKVRRGHRRPLKSGVKELTRIERTKWMHGATRYVKESPVRLI